eukprot:TRINITY_DN4703_c0_g1_i1.p1 TRINITY_DN4703_c0_g1~~TRINITY_DN4703_c0_g1_i1.p1  ORF type:complete len:671 (+),score=84.12 TRINITY_DN4703_c0_g1_i1:66-2078(+)
MSGPDVWANSSDGANTAEPKNKKQEEEEQEEQEEFEEDTEHEEEDCYGVTIAFEELCLRKKTVDILVDVSGMLREGEVTGLLGPEKSGTEELMKSVGGYIQSEGRIYANGLPIEASLYQKCVGYVSKYKADRLALTVKQNLLFAYRMKTRQPKRSSTPTYSEDDDKYEQAEKISCPTCDKETTSYKVCKYCGCLLEGWRLAAKIIGLEEVGDMLLYNTTEEVRKRVAIAAEVLHLPKVLFLEVPTYSLDLTSGMRVMRLLKALAYERGMTVVMTLSQPRRPVYELLDSVILLDEGGLAFSGRTDEVLPYFQEIGLEVNEYDCPSDYFLDLCCQNGSDLVAEYKKSTHYSQLQSDILEYYQEAFSNVTPGISDSAAPSSATRLKHLLYFKLIGIKNEWRPSLAKVGLVFLLGLIAGLVYSDSYTDQDNKQYGMQNRVGMLFFILSALMLGNLNTAADFVARRPLLNHEVSAGYYSTMEYIATLCLIDILLIRGSLTLLFGFLTYFLMGFDFVHAAKNGIDSNDSATFGTLCVCMAMTQLPFSMLALLVGTISPNTHFAQTVMIGIFVIFVAFGGLFINVGSLPEFFSIIQYMSILRLSYESLLVGELEGKDFGCVETETDCYTGDKYLELQDFKPDRKWVNIQVLAGLSVFYLFLATIAMWSKKNKLNYRR